MPAEARGAAGRGAPIPWRRGTNGRAGGQRVDSGPAPDVRGLSEGPFRHGTARRMATGGIGHVPGLHAPGTWSILVHRPEPGLHAPGTWSFSGDGGEPRLRAWGG